jgi:serine/threonine protein kinase
MSNNPVRIFKQTLLERYPGCTVKPVEWTKHSNVLRVHLLWEGVPIDCIAKLIMYITNPKPDVGWNKAADKGYAKEKSIYRRLPDWWPVRFIEGFCIPNVGNVIMATEVPNACLWKDYISARASDKSIARQIVKQVTALHGVGVRHNDLLVKNIVLDCKQCKVSVIDFEKSIFTKSNESQANDWVSLIVDLGMNDNTRGIATQLILLLESRKT